MSLAAEPAKTIEIFCSYAHSDKDEGLRKELWEHLSLLERQGLVKTWYDRQILPGTDWASTTVVSMVK